MSRDEAINGALLKTCSPSRCSLSASGLRRSKTGTSAAKRRSESFTDQVMCKGSKAQTKRQSWRETASRGRFVGVEAKRHLSPFAQFGATFDLEAEREGGEELNRLSRVTARQQQQQKRLDKWLLKLDTSWRGLGCAAWPLDARGKYGESLLHVLLINHSNEHLILAVLLLHLWPNLVFDLFESDKFLGLSCLHLAISNKNTELLGFLLTFSDKCQHEAHGLAAVKAPLTNQLIEHQVSGSLFRSPFELGAGEKSGRSLLRSRGCRISSAESNGAGRPKYWCDQLEHWPAANGRNHVILFDRLVEEQRRRTETSVQRESASAEGGTIYLGHTPLAWCVSFNLRSASELLVHEWSACVDTPDSHGDTCLHQLIVNNAQHSSGWLRFLAVKFKANLEAKNRAQLSPFQLAAQLGRVKLFSELLEMSALEFWSYSSVRCSSYPLLSLDSLAAVCLPEGSKSKPALSVIVESKASTSEQKSALLSGCVVKKLLEEKWRYFARRLCYRDLCFTLAHLLLLTIAISLRKSNQISAPDRKQLVSKRRANPISWTLINKPC